MSDKMNPSEDEGLDKQSIDEPKNAEDSEENATEMTVSQDEKVRGFIIGFLIVAAVLALCAGISYAMDNDYWMVIMIVLDIPALIITAIVGGVVMKNERRRYIGMGMLVISLLPAAFVFIMTGGCGMFL